MGRIHGPSRSRSISVEVRPRVSGYVAAVRFKEGAIVRQGRSAVPDRSAAVPGRSRSPARGAGARPRHRPARRVASCRAPSACARENAMSQEEHDRRAAFAEEVDRAGRRRRGRAARRGAQPRVHARDLADRRPGQPRARHRRQPRVERARRGDAADDRRLARPDSRALRRRRAHLPPLHATARSAGKRNAADASLPIRMALANDQGFPREGVLDFLDNQLDPAERHDSRARGVSQPDGALTPGLFVRLRVAGSGTSQRAARSRTAPSAPISTRSSCWSSAPTTRSSTAP